MIEIIIISVFCAFCFAVHKYAMWHKKQRELRLDHIKQFYSLATELAKNTELSPDLINRLRYLGYSIDQKESFDLLFKAISSVADDKELDEVKERTEKQLPANAKEDWAKAFWHWTRAVSLYTPIKQFIIMAAFARLYTPEKGSSVENKIVELNFKSHLTA